MIRVWSLFAVAVLFTACGPEIAYQDHQDFGEAGWGYSDSISFDFPVTDTSSQFDLVLSVDHTVDFSYQNFYVRLNTYLPDGQVLTQPLSLQLANKFGEWYGDCSGEKCTIDIALQEGTHFTELGNHRLAVTQLSRDEPLAEVTGIGFRIVKR